MFTTSRVTLEDLGLRARTLGSGAASLRENVRFYVGRGMGDNLRTQSMIQFDHPGFIPVVSERGTLAFVAAHMIDASPRLPGTGPTASS